MNNVKKNKPIRVFEGFAGYGGASFGLQRAGIPHEVYIKKGGDHHPHGLSDNTPIVDFILKYDK